MRRKLLFLLTLLSTLWLTACWGSFIKPNAAQPPPLEVFYRIPSKPTPTQPLPQPTPTQTSVHLTATVWTEMPQVPILMYHRFTPQLGAMSSNYLISLTDFDGHLSALYEAGFSLIAISDWLHGSIHIPEGRRPLIITIDDLFYADQISLDQDGQPASYSGVGRLWQFSQDHPDFNFHAGLFYNLGDKSYANSYANGTFSVIGDWRQSRAEVIAWCIENGAIPMNHFYDHPFLNQLWPADIQWELEQNDSELREALALVKKSSLAENLPNILALPYVVWPVSSEGKQVIFDYVSPEGVPVAGIVEGDHPQNAKLFPAPFSPDFDRWHVPRINATWEGINVILARLNEIPIAHTCDLGDINDDPSTQTSQILNAILARVNDGRCPQGIFIVDELVFQVDKNGIIQVLP